MKQWIESATQIQKMLLRDTCTLKEDERALLISFYCEKGQPGRNFDPAYLRVLLSSPPEQLTLAQRADLLAFRAVVSMKAQGMLVSALQSDEKAA